ncbi:unnamed protein product [Vicia faba]|uniref:Uncharacterized protein n=3 Tax=Vicia faba TaxID=3906 RepID=A0AAV0YQT4_VICFA|nr:unnamed protein product [Vicia faba]
MPSSSEVKPSPPVNLHSSQKHSRDKALRILLNSWRSQQILPQNIAKKLWKGLFYCVYHSDNSLVQADLIDRIASHLSTFRHLPLALQYFSTFFLTMRREWSGIDSLRLDKFYLLIRRFISSFLYLLYKNSWNLDLVNLFVNCLDKSTFSAKDRFVQGNGVNYHVASVFLQEVKPFLPVKLSVLEALFRPFFSAVAKLRDKVLLGKIKSGFFNVLLMNGRRLLEVKKGGEESGGDGDVMNLGTIALVMGFSSKLFELASAPDCVQGNRKVLFELHREFLKMEKDVVESGFDFSVPDSVDRVVLDLVSVVEVDGLGKKDSFDKVKEPKKKKRKIKKSDASDFNCEMKFAENDGKNVVSENGGNSNDERGVDGEGSVVFNESVISNLQKKFEKIVAEASLGDGVATGVVSKKRKRTEISKGETSQDFVLNSVDAKDDTSVAKSGEKSFKKVQFSLESNLVWKQHTPLPPQSLRIPPSATPRGSALKKGLPPGPIRETPLPTKKEKQKKSRKTKKRLKKLVDFAKAFMG